MSLRELILHTLAPTAGAPVLARWGRLRYGGRAFRRLLAVEYCAPELLTRLHELGLVEGLRPALASELRERARGDSLRMLGVRLELEAIVATMRARRIPVTLLKGAAFLRAGMRPLRACTDLDLWVAERDLSAAADALAAMGYSQRDEPADEKSLPSYDRPGSAPVELHHRPLVRSGMPEDERWATSALEDGVAVLAPTDWCWHTLAHEAYHSDTAGRARGALDVAALVDRYGDRIDWTAIAGRARRWPDRIEPVVHSLSKLGCAVPLAVSRRARWSVAWSSAAREYAARVAARDDLFVFAVQKVGGLAFARPATWMENRGGSAGAANALVPAMVRDAARLAQVMLGREPA